MNNDRRKALDELYKRLELIQLAVENITDADEVHDLLEAVRDEESEARENMPESLQEGEQGQRSQEAIDNLDTAVDKVKEIADAITTMQDDLREALEAIDNAKGAA